MTILRCPSVSTIDRGYTGSLLKCEVLLFPWMFTHLLLAFARLVWVLAAPLVRQSLPTI